MGCEEHLVGRVLEAKVLSVEREEKASGSACPWASTALADFTPHVSLGTRWAHCPSRRVWLGVGSSSGRELVSHIFITS